MDMIPAYVWFVSWDFHLKTQSLTKQKLWWSAKWLRHVVRAFRHLPLCEKCEIHIQVRSPFLHGLHTEALAELFLQMHVHAWNIDTKRNSMKILRPKHSFEHWTTIYIYPPCPCHGRIAQTASALCSVENQVGPIVPVTLGTPCNFLWNLAACNA